jgi:hypothetical protein
VINKVRGVVLDISYKGGYFKGYIVFYDKRNNMCGVLPPYTCKLKEQPLKPVLKAKEYNFIEALNIHPSSLETYLLEGKPVYAYKIEPFVITGLKKGTKITFEFEWCHLKAHDTVYIL